VPNSSDHAKLRLEIRPRGSVDTNGLDRGDGITTALCVVVGVVRRNLVGGSTADLVLANANVVVIPDRLAYTLSTAAPLEHANSNPAWSTVHHFRRDQVTNPLSATIHD
jgi:hypothetical protein